ncbi:MAG: pitrilysin family protein [Caldibacillus sp.]
MANTQEIKVKKGGITYHIIPTEKFKTNTFIFKFKAPLRKEDATKRALLANVLQSGTQQYPSRAKMRAYLDDLYGASFSIDLQKKGEYHIISISMEIANEQFLSVPEPLLDKAFTFLHEVIFRPLVKDRTFHPEIVKREKETLKQRIQALYDDKMRYANMRLIEEMCKDEPYSIPVNGILEDVDPITPENLYTYYEQVLNEDEIDLYIIGDLDPEGVVRRCDETFSFAERTPKHTEHERTFDRKEERVVVEKQEVAQGKLNIGYRTNIRYGDDDYFALQMFNGLFGGFPHSKLFINVREKASLAYYATSRLESHKGLILVMTGIETKNYERALAIIREQLQAMQKGDFTDKEIEQTKAVIHNQMLETLDTSRGLTEVLYHNVISKKNVTEEMWIDGINNVTKEDIVRVANKIVPDTVYFLSGMEA